MVALDIYLRKPSIDVASSRTQGPPRPCTPHPPSARMIPTRSARWSARRGSAIPSRPRPKTKNTSPPAWRTGKSTSVMG